MSNLNTSSNNTKVKKVWLITGETSGDMYGAKIAGEIHKIADREGRQVEVSGMGGVHMKEAGVNLLADSTELGVIGIVEVFKHIFTFFQLFRKLVKLAEAEQPDAVVMIDYPGFNLALAKALYKRKIPVIWYISPQVWAWKKYRIFKLEKYCRKMLVIFPFEEEVYKITRLDTEFVGHPLLEMVEAKRNPAYVRDPDLVLLLPGSRAMEVNRLLLPMLETAGELKRKHPNLKFVLTAPRPKIFAMCNTIYDRYRQRNPEAPIVEILPGETAKYQQLAGTGLAASGTVTVESAIAGLPLVVVYKLNWITVLVAAVLIKLYRGFFTMVNVIANKQVFEEFFQHHVCPAELTPAMERILPGGERRQEVKQDIVELRKMLAPESTPGGSALRQAAKRIYESIYQPGWKK